MQTEQANPSESAEPVVTISKPVLEEALRRWPELCEYDLHKSTECHEESGEDSCPEEAARFFAFLRQIAKA